LNAEYRIAAQIKEIVMHSNTLNAQDVRPDLSQHLFDVSARRCKNSVTITL